MTMQIIPRFVSQPRQPLRFALLALLIALGAGLVGLPAAAEPAKKNAEEKLSRAATKEAIAQLPQRHREWLEEVELLIAPEERDAFLALGEDYQRDAFIDQFWRVRDPDPRTARNEFRDRWEAMREEVDRSYSGPGDERAELLMLNGPPDGVLSTNCPSLLVPMEIWIYSGSDRVNSEFFLVFYRRFGVGPYRLWYPLDGLSALFDSAVPGQRSVAAIANGCHNGRSIAAVLATSLNDHMAYTSMLARASAPAKLEAGEWVETFDAYSTNLPQGADTFPAELELAFPGRYQSRTLLQGILTVPRDAVGVAVLGDSRSYNFVVNGEILADDKLFDSFRYKFDFPASQVAGEQIPLVVERRLRPGDYELILMIEDLASGKYFRTRRPITVPEVARAAAPPPPADAETARLLAEANSLLTDGDTGLKLIRPGGELLTGMVRFDTLVAGGEVERVAFTLNGQPLLVDRQPPFSVELDLGSLPRTHTLRATAYGTGDAELASDEILVNAGGTRFRVRLVEPRPGRTYVDSLRARAELEVPDGETVERVELYLNEDRVATLYSEPWVQPIVLPGEASIGYVRAVAYLDDGNSTEDSVFINAPEYIEEVDVQFVELYTTVLDRGGRPIDGLARADFSVAENGAPQQILRFEQVRDLPIHAGILFDVSASMEGRIDATRQAALQFFQQIIRPKDRAAVITFNDRPNLTVKFTNDLETLAGGLAGLKAERGTALYDSLIFSLYYFNGVKGQRALLLLSDGKDESSRFTWDDVLEYARRAGVTIYAVGLDLPRGPEKRQLTRLAEETGGRSFFIDSPTELAAVYAQVEEELRSQYLIAYQSTNTDTSGAFRTVDLDVDRPGVEVKTLRGYYP